jgi:hypothetical protein
MAGYGAPRLTHPTCSSDQAPRRLDGRGIPSRGSDRAFHRHVPDSVDDIPGPVFQPVSLRLCDRRSPFGTYNRRWNSLSSTGRSLKSRRGQPQTPKYHRKEYTTSIGRKLMSFRALVALLCGCFIVFAAATNTINAQQPVLKCGYNAATKTCGGSCPKFQTCTIKPGSTQCSCKAPEPCGYNAKTKTCGGSCPPGRICTSGPKKNSCVCKD